MMIPAKCKILSNENTPKFPNNILLYPEVSKFFKDLFDGISRPYLGFHL